MKSNLGTIDRLIRVVAAIGIFILYYTEYIAGAFGITLMIISVILILTSFVSFCPLYSLLGVNTCDKPDKPFTSED